MCKAKDGQVKKAIGKWNYEADVECPHCHKDLDLLSEVEEAYDEGSIYSLIEGDIANQTVSVGETVEYHPQVVDWDLECPKCAKPFQLEKMEYRK